MATDEAKDFRAKALAALTEIQGMVKEARDLLNEMKAAKAKPDPDDDDD